MRHQRHHLQAGVERILKDRLDWVTEITGGVDEDMDWEESASMGRGAYVPPSGRPRPSCEPAQLAALSRRLPGAPALALAGRQRAIQPGAGQVSEARREDNLRVYADIVRLRDLEAGGFGTGR